MDRRRFFMNKSLNEGLSIDQKRTLLEDVFAELNRLYEADETTGDTGAAEEQPAAETKEDEAAEAIMDKLQKSDYEQFVNILNSDGKSKAFLRYLRQHYKIGDDSLGAVKAANPQIGTISCNKLHPTQENISLSKSLGMISEPGWSEKIINSPTEAFDTPTVTYAGQYIIDGHHRWSKAYALNGGDCKIKVLNFPAIDGVTWEDMLKAVQLAIVAMVPSAKLVNTVDNDNMLADNGSASKKYYIEHACDQVIEAMKKKGRGDTKEAQGDFVSTNVAQMKQTSAPVSDAKPRAIMPQMDDAGKAKAKIVANGIIDVSK